MTRRERPANLSVKSRRYQFDASRLSSLQRRLTAQERATQIRLIMQPADILLTREGTVKDQQIEYRYTTDALRRLCGLAADGLFQLIDDVSGQIRRESDPVRAYSKPVAVSLFNTVIKQRFTARFAHRTQLLRNTQTREIEGIASRQYKSLSNMRLLQLLEAAVGDAFQFQGAVLTGRRLAVQFRDKAPMCTVTDDEPIFAGIYVANSETAGESSVQARALLCNTTHATYGISSPADYGGRVVHTGDGFESRVVALLRNTLEELDALRDCAADIRRVSKQILRSTARTGKEQVDEIARVLQRAGLRAGVAGKIAVSAVQFGRNSPSSAAVVPCIVNTACTAYDLFSAISHCAKRFPPRVCGEVANVAFKVLTGRVTIE